MDFIIISELFWFQKQSEVAMGSVSAWMGDQCIVTLRPPKVLKCFCKVSPKRMHGSHLIFERMYTYVYVTTNNILQVALLPMPILRSP